MHAQTYKDLVDGKIKEWQQALGILEKQQAVKRVSERVEQLKPAVDMAITQLSALVDQETVGNTMETKEEILKIFTLIDEKFSKYQDKTPFML